MRMKLFTFFIFWIVTSFCFSQEFDHSNTTEIGVDYTYGEIPQHNPSIAHLITGHPEGFILSYSQKTFGKKEWEALYNYPDYGSSFVFQDMKNPYLGENYGLYVHYNFYFLNRHVLFRIAQGIAYNTNPYDLDENYQNNAYGSHFLASTYILLNYTHKNIFENFGLQAGINLMHYSNGNIKAPNTSTNTLSVNVGVNYSLQKKEELTYISYEKKRFSEPVHLNFVFRSGIQSSSVINLGQYPFYTFGVYADKRISKKSSFWLGSEVFFSPMLKEYIKFRSIAYSEDHLSGDESSTRAGAFLGYQLFVGKVSAFLNLGYYYYYPFDFEGRIYDRAGLQYAISPKFSVSFSVKAHAAKAEAMEFSVGYRL